MSADRDPYLERMARLFGKELTKTPSDPPAAGTEDQAFNVLWTDYVAKSKNPKYYNESHKAIAHLGWTWAIAAFRKFGNRIT